MEKPTHTLYYCLCVPAKHKVREIIGYIHVLIADGGKVKGFRTRIEDK